MTSTLTHGGRRERSGRKPAPSKTVRVALGSEAVARQLADLVLARATDLLMESAWYRAVPADLRGTRPKVVLEGIKHHAVFSSKYSWPGDRSEPFIVFHAVVGPYKGTFRMHLDLGKGGLVTVGEAAGTDTAEDA